MPDLSLCSLDYLVWWHFSSMGRCSCPSHFLVSTSFIVVLCRRSLGPVASHIGTCSILETGISLNFVSYCPKSFFISWNQGGVPFCSAEKSHPSSSIPPTLSVPGGWCHRTWNSVAKKTKKQIAFRSIYKPWHQSTFQTPLPSLESSRAELGIKQR